jgi:hypothetical protein
MATEERLDQALASSDPVRELRSVVVRLNAEGLMKDDVLAHLERRRQALRAAGREREEDAVMDAMDFVNRWCSPHMKLKGDPCPAANGAASRSPMSPAVPDGQRRGSQGSRTE